MSKEQLIRRGLSGKEEKNGFLLANWRSTTTRIKEAEIMLANKDNARKFYERVTKGFKLKSYNGARSFREKVLRETYSFFRIGSANQKTAVRIDETTQDLKVFDVVPASAPPLG